MFTKQATHTIKTKRDNRGFTLIEVLIAMAIFSIGILAIGSMQVTSINSNARARMHTEGYTWVGDRIERLTTLSYDDDDLTAGDHGPVAEGTYAISWFVQDDTPLTGTKAITVTVTGANPRARPLSIVYIKAQ
jgi:prepilin-type N-terminal cleavage/methylation domain-containing protein